MQEIILSDFLGGPVVKNPMRGCRFEGSIRGQGTKIPHASGQLNSGISTKTGAVKNKYFS